MNKIYSVKAIYTPKGKAGEYSRWACNFFTGCSNGCEYCYCRRGVLSSVWSDRPCLRKCFRDENHALECFIREAERNIDALREDGIFFSFTSDPALSGTWPLTIAAMQEALSRGIPVQVLTKMSLPSYDPTLLSFTGKWRGMTAMGFTLTGHDELEPGADTNAQRIEAMRFLHDTGFPTFASIEPIVDFESALRMIRETEGFCDLYKVGLMSGKKYSAEERKEAINMLEELKKMPERKFYIKDSLISLTGMDRADLPGHFVSRGYHIQHPGSPIPPHARVK